MKCSILGTTNVNELMQRQQISPLCFHIWNFWICHETDKYKIMKIKASLVEDNQLMQQARGAKVERLIIRETKEMGQKWLPSIISAPRRGGRNSYLDTLPLQSNFQRYFIFNGIFGANLILCALTNLISAVDKSDLLLLKCLISFRKVVQLENIVQWQIWCFLTRSIATKLSPRIN